MMKCVLQMCLSMKGMSWDICWDWTCIARNASPIHQGIMYMRLRGILCSCVSRCRLAERGSSTVLPPLWHGSDWTECLQL